MIDLRPPQAPIRNLLQLLLRTWRASHVDTLLAEVAAASTSGKRRASIRLILESRRLKGRQRIFALEQAVATDDSYARAYSFLGYARVAASDLTGAAEAFEAASGIDPANIGASLGLAQLRADAGDPAAAAEVLRALVEQHPHDPKCHRASTDALSTAGDQAGVEGEWGALLPRVEGGGRTWQTLDAGLRAAAAAGDDDMAEALARWLRTAGPDGATSLRPWLLEVLGGYASARRLAWWADNLAGGARSASRPADEHTPAKATAAADLIDACQRWAQALPVETWAIDRVEVWPILRVHFAFQLLAASRGRASIGRRTKPTASASIASAAHNARLFAKQITTRKVGPADALFLGTSSQRQVANGVAWDRLFDPVADAIEASGGTVAHLEYRGDDNRYRAHQRRPSLYIRPAVEGVMRAPPRVRPWRVELPGYQTFATRVQASLARFGGSDPVPPATRWIGKVGQLLRLSDYFDDIFERVRPKVAICTSYFTTLGWAFLLAARRHRVRTVDLQHGVTSGHPAYDGWRHFPADGYALLPEVFWAWTAEDAARVERWPTAGHRAIVGGHPWVAHCTRLGGGGEALDRIAAEPGGRAVLVSLNWSTGLAEVLKQVITASPARWTWWVRLHPVMESERSAVQAWCSQQAQRVFVDVPTDLPLPTVLGATDVHLTLCSTVTQEAARLGVPSVVVDARGATVFAPEVASGWARCETGGPEAILWALETQAAAKSDLTPLDPYPSYAVVERAVASLMST